MVVFRFGDIKSLIPIDQIPIVEQQLAVYWSSPWYDTLLGALERSFTIVFHISAALLVLQVFVRKQGRWLWLAVLWHTIANAGAVYIVTEINPYAAEVWMGFVCLVSFVIIYLLRDSNDNQNGSHPPTIEYDNLPDLPKSVELTDEHLEGSRYSLNSSD
jgi:uncharacterized membrane protein YhfC